MMRGGARRGLISIKGAAGFVHSRLLVVLAPMLVVGALAGELTGNGNPTPIKSRGAAPVRPRTLPSASSNTSSPVSRIHSATRSARRDMRSAKSCSTRR